MQAVWKYAALISLYHHPLRHKRNLSNRLRPRSCKTNARTQLHRHSCMYDTDVCHTCRKRSSTCSCGKHLHAEPAGGACSLCVFALSPLIYFIHATGAAANSMKMVVAVTQSDLHACLQICPSSCSCMFHAMSLNWTKWLLFVNRFFFLFPRKFRKERVGCLIHHIKD